MRGREDSDSSIDRWSRKDWWSTVLDAPDGPALAHFYADLLGWEFDVESADGAGIAPPGSVVGLAFQTSSGYVRPVWPSADGSQQMMMHLDFEVSDLEAAVAHALELGAELADYQPQDNVRVLLDPAGHPFCLYTD